MNYMSENANGKWKYKKAHTFELHQFVQTAQKEPLWQIILKFKQHTDIAFLVVSVLFLVVFFHCCKNVCTHL